MTDDRTADSNSDQSEMTAGSEPSDEKFGPRYWPSRTVEAWRAYHREYYRKNAAKRRAQAAKYHSRRVYKQALARYSGLVPDRIIKLLFLRDSQPKRG